MCEIHKLPLAQTWVPGIVTCHAMNVIDNNDNNRTIFVDSNESNSKNNNSNNNSSSGRNHVCLKIVDGLHNVNDPHVWGFYCACL
jgi:hypothetical protein